MKKNSFIYGLLMLILIMIFSSCNNGPQKKEVYLILKTLNSPFFTMIEKGAQENINKEKYELIIRAGRSETDIDFQIRTLKLISENENLMNIAGVIITPSSSDKELLPYIKKLIDSKVPVIIVDTKVNKEALTSIGINELPYIGSSNFDGGRQAGAFVCTLLPNTDIKSILILNGVDGQESAVQRRNGFVSVIDSVFKNKKIEITHRTANWNRLQANNIVSAFLAQGKYFNIIFAANDEMALGAIRALENKTGEQKKPVIIGFDAIDEAKENILQRKGLTATIEQMPYDMGKTAVFEIQNGTASSKIESKFIPTRVIK